MNAAVSVYQFIASPAEGFAELQRVTLTASTMTDDDVEVPTGTSGTVVAIWPEGALYEVDFPLGLATVEASKLTSA